MEQLEKVEKLRQRANVSYEEAKNALQACDWDMLEAMVYLEKLGKVESPNQQSFSTSFEEQPQYTSVEETVKRNSEYHSEERFGSKLKRVIRKLIKIGKENDFLITREGREVLKVPVLVFVIALFFAWEAVVPVMIIALFFGCHYSFKGKGNLSSVNEAMEKASNLADRVKDEYNKL